MQEFKMPASIKGKYEMISCVEISEENASLGKTRVCFKKRNGKDVIVYAISTKQVDELKKIGIELGGFNCHHFVAQRFLSLIDFFDKWSSDNEKRRKFKKIKEDLKLNMVIYLLRRMHELNNGYFHGCLTPEEMLTELDRRIDLNLSCNGNKQIAIDYFSIVSVLSKDGYVIDADKVAELRSCGGEILTGDLLECFDLTKQEIVTFLENFFFYPGYKKFNSHFKFLSELPMLVSELQANKNGGSGRNQKTTTHYLDQYR